MGKGGHNPIFENEKFNMAWPQGKRMEDGLMS